MPSRLPCLLCLLLGLLSTNLPHAMAEQCRTDQRPWLAYGAQVLPSGSLVDDPAPNVNGVVGEVTSLPYEVPSGHQLIVTSAGMSGNPAPQAGLVLWVGDGEATNAKTIPATDSAWSSAHAPALQTVLPAGMRLHVRLINSTVTSDTYAWYVVGCLAPVP
jgi:hypothetical protein